MAENTPILHGTWPRRPPSIPTQWDNGCEYFTDCLNCPLVVCAQEEFGFRRFQALLVRRAVARLYWRVGLELSQITQVLGVHRKTVQRAFNSSSTKKPIPQLDLSHWRDSIVTREAQDAGGIRPDVPEWVRGALA